jgi:hypothetical protein
MIQTQIPPIILIMFVSPDERCGLENLGSHLARSCYRRPNFLKKRKKRCTFCRCEMVANLIRVAPECRDTSGLAYLYRGTFGRWACFQKG